MVDDAQLIPNHMESMQEQLNELSEYAYSKISWYQFSIEDILERIHNISNAVQKMDERWTRNDEATRSFIAAWSRIIRTRLGGVNLQGSLHKEFLDIDQKEVNRAWWQPPLRLDSWKPVQSCSRYLSEILASCDRYSQVANGPDNLFTQQRSIPDNNPAVPDEHSRATTTGIGSHQSCRPVGQTSINEVVSKSFDRLWSQNVQMGIEGNRRTNMVSTEMSLNMQEAQLEKLGDELKTLVDDNYQPLDRGHNELFRCMAEMRTEILSMQHNPEKEATRSPSIDANKATSIDVKPYTSQIPTEPKSLAEKKDEWEIAYINMRINDVYNPLNNNVDWLSTRIDLLQQELDTIRMNDPQPATSIDICNITSIDTRFAALENRLKSYEDMHDRFTSPIMRYLDTLSTQIMIVQKDICKLNDQHDFQEEGSTSIDRFRRKSLDGKKPIEHLPYTTSEVEQITSKLYTAIDTLEDRLEKRCDGIYFPFDVKLSGLDSQAEWLQKEVKAIQRQLASQHQISTLIDRGHSKSIDIKAPETIDRHLVASIDTTSIADDAHTKPHGVNAGATERAIRIRLQQDKLVSVQH
ncbi:hypothetical protein F2Q69_00006272 [Brassica cretica]|uniref:Uncharacterized protein n=1 Tax=Brassica cretica TaxID=69181 RepID=A0A8S9PKI1_BRACR|nr:hypothetical protein F2Q69_00006272 [Brassica cretica]